MAFRLFAFIAVAAAAQAAELGHAVSYNSQEPATRQQQLGLDDYASPSQGSYRSFSRGTQTEGHHYVAGLAAAKIAATPVETKYAAPAYTKVEEEEHYAPAHYSFGYSVHDSHTHDIKEQKEERHGDVVKGMYSLIEADGSKRIVEYTADHHNGFNAIVHREPASHPVAVKSTAPVTKDLGVSAPISHSSPLNYHH